MYRQVIYCFTFCLIALNPAIADETIYICEARWWGFGL